ncbi:hypothetical protein K2173_013404 [Erythroxylum novogranatense]|uniref:ATP-dependent DNA helicase 2 subunit KU80 n=1 Tax=Erythroxylum novogranatense TaxID=1862640 RepID=A0AAV8SAB4_9ROSI|nr:hypothetical protein K2173_013404 [Erythroxylum novogranatense]
MARNREGLVLLLDVGPSMHETLPEVEKLCSMLIQKKLIYSKQDEVGIVVFGTKETENELTKEVGGYEHVVVLQNIKVADGSLVEALQRLPRGTASGDYLDAIVVGMDMLIKKYQSTNKGKKRLCLITNALDPVKDPYEGTKEDQVSTIATQMTAYGMKMESIIARIGLKSYADQKIMEENDNLLDIFSWKTSAKIVYVDSPISLLGALRTRKIAPVTIFRGGLELSPNMKIKVWVYKKTSEEKFPTLKKYSDKAPPTDKFATHEVKVDYEYKSVEDDSKVVPPEQRIKGYRYGPQVVPISSAEWDAVRFRPEKSVKLLGFTDAKNVMRHYYMKDANIFIAEPGNIKATLGVSALARAMKEMDKVAIVRCVWREGQANVVVGVLMPNISKKENTVGFMMDILISDIKLFSFLPFYCFFFIIMLLNSYWFAVQPDSFYFNVLPFTEDVREFLFPSFSSFPAACQPTEQQQEAADNLVKMLDLAPAGRQEALPPDFTPNPVLERFYSHLELKSKEPDRGVPPLDATLKKITEPDPELLSRNKSVIDAFRGSFEIKENPKLKKATRRVIREKPSGSDGEDGYEDAPNAIAVASNEQKPIIEVEKIGNSTPVQDFEAMISRRDNPDWIIKAIGDMKDRILDLLRNSHEGDNFPKAFDCLLALRKGCILEQEPKQFNDFLRHLFKYLPQRNLSNFCDFLAAKGLTLVSKSEAPDSDVKDEEARSFLYMKEPKVES